MCTYVLGQDQGKLKVRRPASPSSPGQLRAEVEVEPAADVDKMDTRSEYHSRMPFQDMDEMDAAEAAQFKADVQGHRQAEVRIRLV